MCIRDRFEFYELYRRFLPLYREHRKYFYDWCTIGSIYGAPAGCIWGGGRISCGGAAAREVLALSRIHIFQALLCHRQHQLDAVFLMDPGGAGVVGKGMVNKIRALYPSANITPIDYDPSATKVNQENRIKLMLAVEMCIRDSPLRCPGRLPVGRRTDRLQSTHRPGEIGRAHV